MKSGFDCKNFSPRPGLAKPAGRGPSLFLAAMLASLLVACGGGSDDATPVPPAGNVGPAGATITAPDGKATLQVPAGALSTTIQVGLTPATTGFLADPQIVPGSVYRLDAPDIALAQPATLSIQIPASAASGVSTALSAPSERSRALAVLDGPTPLDCTPATQLGDEVLPGTVCEYKWGVGLPGQLPGPFPGCPSALPLFQGEYDVTETSTFSGYLYYFKIAACASSNYQLAQLSPNTSLTVVGSQSAQGSGSAQVILTTFRPATFGIVNDTTAPVVQLSAIVTPTSPGQGTLTLTANATDNIRVTRVDLGLWELGGTPPTLLQRGIGEFVVPPYVWTSAPRPLDQIYGVTYFVKAYDGAGNQGMASLTLDPAPAAPAIASFAANPAAVPFGGAAVTLSWAVSNAASLSVDHGVGDVTGLSSKLVTVTTPTTFTLTATNANGSTTATTAVTVMAQPAPTIASFTATPATLPTGGGAVTLAWTTTDANTLSVDNGVGVVTGTSQVVNVNASSTFTLTATNTSGTVSKQAAVVVAANNDRFVDIATGADTNACSQTAPCKTIAKAMTGAPSGATVFLGDGTYASATQGGTVTIADGVTLRATQAGAATVAGVRMIASGSAGFSGLVLDTDAFSCASIDAEQALGSPTLTLTGVLMKCLGALKVGGKVVATMTPGALAGGLYTSALPGSAATLITVLGNAVMEIDGGVIDGNGLGGAAFGPGMLAVSGNGRLTLAGVTLRNRMTNGISVVEPATLVLRDNTVIDKVGIAGPCPVGSAIVMNGAASLTMDRTQISNSPNAGVCVRSAAAIANIHLSDSTLSMNRAAISSEPGGGSTAAVVVDSVSMTNNQYGIIWDGGTASTFDIRNSIVTGNVVGVQVTFNAGTFKLRGSNVSSNSDLGVAMYGLVSADLGTQADPGLNTLTGNSNVGLKLNLNPGQTVQAVGNKWIASQQGADANGLYSVAPTYAPVTQAGPQSGKNYSLLSGVTAKF